MSALSINTKTKGVNVNINSSDSGNDCEALSVLLESLYILSLNYGLINIKNKSQNTFEKDPTLRPRKLIDTCDKWPEMSLKYL